MRGGRDDIEEDVHPFFFRNRKQEDVFKKDIIKR